MPTLRLVNPMHHVGGGPWRVLADCPARKHNTAHAARGCRGVPKCICPQALAARTAQLEGYVERRAALRRDRAMPRKTASLLPGGGPWRVLSACPAMLHNTVRAATKGRPEHRCTCPRALDLLELDTQRIAERNVLYARRTGGNPMTNPQEIRRRRNPLWAQGYGPFIVLPDCPATAHNTLAAARGSRGARAGQGYFCICPQAAHLKTQYKAEQAEKKRLRNMGIEVPDGRAANNSMPRSGRSGPRWAPEKAIATATYFVNTLGAVIPSMPQAACKTPDGIKLADAAAEGRSMAEPAMKRLCGSCPERVKCSQWVLADERFAGEWGGVYGGMTVVDRRKMRAEIDVFRSAPQWVAS